MSTLKKDVLTIILAFIFLVIVGNVIEWLGGPMFTPVENSSQ